MKVVIAHGIDLCEPYLDNRIALEAEAIMEAGHEVTVVCWARTVSGEIVDGAEEEVVNEVNVRRVFSPASTPDKPLPKRIFEHLLAKQKISKIIKNLDPDIVHFNDLDTAVIALFWSNGPVWVYDAREYYAGMVSHLPWPLPGLANFLERLVVRRADGIITVSPVIMRRLASYGASSRILVYNSREPERFVASRKPGELRRLWGVKTGELVVIYIGSLGPGRSIMEMIDAVDNMDQISFIVGGHGVWAREVRESAAKSGKTNFVGPIPSGDLPDYYAAADVVLGALDPNYPNHQLAMPNKLFESISAGRPLVAARGTLVGEVIEKEGIGEVTDYGNREGMIRALGKLRNPEIRKKYGDRGLKLAKGEYGWRWQARKLRALYRSIAKA
ncbi:MAG: glycosyltransferase family 4 protein [Candidatus Thermoplasmatota archaeon]|nr:glycosyltransferase family 4 protein [Candidatus Thermoplasmatota archaeon]